MKMCTGQVSYCETCTVAQSCAKWYEFCRMTMVTLNGSGIKDSVPVLCPVSYCPPIKSSLFGLFVQEYIFCACLSFLCKLA